MELWLYIVFLVSRCLLFCPWWWQRIYCSNEVVDEPTSEEMPWFYVDDFLWQRLGCITPYTREAVDSLQTSRTSCSVEKWYWCQRSCEIYCWFTSWWAVLSSHHLWSSCLVAQHSVTWFFALYKYSYLLIYLHINYCCIVYICWLS